MAKLMVEDIAPERMSVITESINGGKRFYIEGPMLEADVKNINGRIYPLDIITREVQRYNVDYIQKKRSLGEVDHPQTNEINLDRVSHNIVSLDMQDNVAYGKALILNTPMGKIVQALLEDEIQLGVSSRGVGSVDAEFVKEFRISSIDVVLNPSCRKAFVNGILESVDFLMDGHEEVFDKPISNLKLKIQRQYTPNNKSRILTEAMVEFINDINKRLI